MLFRPLFDGESSTSTYLLASRPGGEALLIDPVDEKTPQYIELIRCWRPGVWPAAALGATRKRRPNAPRGRA